ncbi:hypothetical protein [Streptomyces sp. NPDC048496]|uniref:hypothetical protein n=1 Tax=Streptomyces sp. NPDC048496 TaxID=3365558 RepID=UPI00371F4B4D
MLAEHQSRKARVVLRVYSVCSAWPATAGSCAGPGGGRPGFGGRTAQLAQGLERLTDALEEARR